MKRNLLIAASALGLAALAAPAFAQNATGTVGITGTVTAKCFTSTDGSSTTFNDTMTLGEIDQSSGVIRTDLASSTAVGAATKTFTVNCTGVNNKISITPSVFQTSPVTGTSNVINYTAEADFAGVATPFTATTTAPLVSANVGAIPPGANNLTVKAYSFLPTGGLTSPLAAGSYSGSIAITIGPSA